MFTFNKKYFIAAVLLFLAEVYIAFYPPNQFIRHYVGDYLVVIFLYCFIKAFIKIPAFTAAIGVLIFSYLVELSQYYRLIYRLNLQDYLLANLIMGTDFEWMDIVAYTLGIATVLLVEKIGSSNKNSDF